MLDNDTFVCVSVGEWHGRSGRAIADNLPANAIMFAVDTWNGSSGEPDMHATAKEREGDHAHSWWLGNLWEHVIAGRVIPIRSHSLNAAETLHSLGLKVNMLFIDADHSYEGIMSDVKAWAPLMKEGALWCGHDYYPEGEEPFAWIGVRQAVQELFPDAQKVATSIWWTRSRPKLTTPSMGDENGIMRPRSKVYDTFIFSSELDLLEIRLNTLYDVVDRFVIVEGTKYHSGADKPLFFSDSIARFEKFLPKIIHIIVDDWPEATGNIYDNAWMMERWQRDAILRGLTECKDNDIIILGDADEIPNPEAIKNYKVEQGLCRLKQRMFYYYLNCENKEGWDWQKIAPYKTVKELTPCGIRYPPAGDTPLIENAGWHWSFLGNSESILSKIKTYSHREFDVPEIANLDHIEQSKSKGLDVFGRPLQYELVEIDATYPKYVKENEERLRSVGLIKPINYILKDVKVEINNDSLRFKDIDTLPVDVDKVQREFLDPSPMMVEFPVVIPHGGTGTVTACISTKDRYHTTLPLTIAAIATQTHRPDKLKIYDDGEQLDLREMSPFNGLLKMCDELKIEWEILKTPRKGQVANHQHCLDACDTDLIWRIDDDEIPMPNTLEILLNTTRDYGCGGEEKSIGAVAGLVHHPGAVSPLPEFIDGSLKDVERGMNMQWFEFRGEREVQHLYSTFLYRADAARKAGGYPKELSTIGHSEESILSHLIFRAGYKLIVTPRAKTWHLRQETGGIRSFNDQGMWERDIRIFQSYLKEWGMDGGKPTKLIVIDAGIGDHYALRSILPQLKKQHADKDLVFATCYPEVFDGDDIKQISIADAKNILGDRYDDSSIYKQLWQRGLTNCPLAEGMLEVWG